MSSSEVYVIIAPSGTGKTTLNRRLITENPAKLAMSISYTTRPKRPNEVEGEHYHFVSEQDFESLVEENKMLEWAKVHKNYYGTPLQEIERIRSQGKKVLLEIDIQGWQSTKKLIPDATSIFIMPPTIKAMWSRLESRGTDDLRTRLIRLDSAKIELAGAHTCDHFIINDEIEHAYDTLSKIIIEDIPPELQRKTGIDTISSLLDTIETADWLKEIRNSIDD